MLRRGFLTVRIWIPACCYLGAAVLLFLGIIETHFTPAVWFDVAGMALISAANPPLDAARLDIMPAGLWGRAESTRTFLRSVTQAIAAVACGGLADLIAGIAPVQSPPGTHPGLVSPSTARGLEFAFLIMLSTLAAAGVVIARARRTYPVESRPPPLPDREARHTPARPAQQPHPELHASDQRTARLRAGSSSADAVTVTSTSSPTSALGPLETTRCANQPISEGPASRQLCAPNPNRTSPPSWRYSRTVHRMPTSGPEPERAGWRRRLLARAHHSRAADCVTAGGALTVRTWLRLLSVEAVLK